jgi:hypothetical protein
MGLLDFYKEQYFLRLLPRLGQTLEVLGHSPNQMQGTYEGGYSPCEGGYPPHWIPAVIPRPNPNSNGSNPQKAWTPVQPNAAKPISPATTKPWTRTMTARGRILHLIDTKAARSPKGAGAPGGRQKAGRSVGT